MTNEKLAEAIAALSTLSKEARVEMIRTSPFGEELFMGYYFSEYIKYPFAPFHFEMFQDWRDLQSGKIRELAWIMFRESAKTSITKVLMTKAVCLKERFYINVDSFDKDNSETFLFDVAQNLLTNRRILQDFGYLYEKRRSNEEMTMTRIGKFLTKNNIIAEAHSVAESVRGRIYGAQRPDFVCHQKGTDIFTEGKWMKVEEHDSFSKERNESGKIVSLYSIPDTETVTNEHRYWAKRIPLERVIKTTIRKQKEGETGWVEAKDLTKNHWIGLPIDMEEISSFPMLPRYFPSTKTVTDKETGRIISSEGEFLMSEVKELNDPEWWWMIGLWWGDGHLSGGKDYTIGLTIANSDISTQERVDRFLKERNLPSIKSERVGCYSLLFNNTVVARWLRTWRTGNSMKTPPLWVEKIPIEFQKQLILGYIAADGYSDNRNKSIRITSVCLSGLHSARRILARIGIAASIRNGIDGKDDYEICGVKCKTKKKYDLRFREGASKLGFDIENQSRYQFPETFIKDGYLWSKVKSVEESKIEAFCPITTKTHTYITRFGLSHNCLDDFETNKTKDSEAYTNITKSHIDEFATGLDSKASILYLGNYITKTGIVQWIMDRSKIDEKIRVRFVPIEEGGQPTWPEKYCMTDVEADQTGKISLESKKKQFGFVLYQTEMMNNPIGTAQQIFKKEMFKYITLEEVLQKSCRVFITIDTVGLAKKNSLKKGDFIGICINFVDREGFWNIMTLKRKMDSRDLINTMFDYWSKYNAEEIGWEKTQFTEGLKSTLETEKFKRGKFPLVQDLKSGGVNKNDRIRGALLGRYEAGSIRHIENYCEGLEDELLAFPNSVHDDVSDSLAYQDQIAKSPFSQSEMKVVPNVPQNCS